ncbi:MAG: long-chain fatty acid--CoA ligase [Nitrospirae bacterium]|nr:long-chain fatty acid--CoA ligase [Nitrospirota bacterium]MBU6479261.1 long-chain fatty acid--CoA ligase [Nitrospirota bacterium]MDE3039586.1 long-chain fatty acid--CoA ligase [Nitrospirota bacterium]MDE3048976.1 long-chain fatty acid--CoA ligase [Nitrospirota bacterium]MDE3220567.1 long-chain fatty acid--CoA ligase [Nitrospirota bacterium]
MPEQPWFLYYPEGVPHQLSLSPETLLEMFSRSARRFPRRPALYFFGKTLSYQECHRLVERFACSLAALGIRKGDRVALCLPNSPQAVIAYFGILKAGGIVVACNPTYTEHELSHQLQDAGARAIVVLDLMYQKIQHLDLELIIVTRITDFMTTIAKYIYQHRNGRPPLEIPVRDRTLFFHDVLDRVTSVAPEELPIVTPDDIAVLQYTGGTTGVSKGAELRHRNLTANLQQLISWFSPAERVESFLAALPLFHVFGMTVTQNICLAVGGCMVLVPDPRNMPVLLTLLRKKRPTVITLVPALVRKLLEHCDANDFTEARFFICGGAALPYELLKKFKERTGHMIIEGYGLSEASPVTHCNIPRGLSVKRSIGLPIANTEAKIVDETGQEVPSGEIGELWVRGPQVMQGYWNNPVETANVLKPEGWLATGDIAREDQDGFFYIVDRKKDMILSTSGFNVYPGEIEQVLVLHQHVSEAAVIGVQLRDGSESIKAFVVITADSVSEDDLLAHCRRYLASYKVPKKVEFRTELPRSILGKTLHRVLRVEEAMRLHLQRS